MSVGTKLVAPINWWRRYVDRTGHHLLRWLGRVRELLAFAVISLSVLVTKSGVSRSVIRPLVFEQVWGAGVRLMPTVAFLGIGLGLVIIGQTVALLTRVGAQQFIGTVMAAVVVRELGPLLTAIVVLARSGTASVVELGTVRALGEVEALESLGIDPIHYLVIPRLVGLAVAVFCLSTYLIMVSVVGGYLFVFLQDVPLRPGAYFGQLAEALRWQDFVLLALKTSLFGIIIAVVNCYHGLARPLKIEDVSQVTTRAVVESLVGCLVVDVVFLVGYVFV
jgi:phospholipid/cholesterol/gamma-HCH transport system permease protein